MQQPVGGQAGRPSRATPFGLDLSMAVFDRASRLAKSMFSAAGASIILVHEGQIWRSAYAADLPDKDPVTEAVLASGKLFWVEDGKLDPRFADHPLVTGPPFLRFTASMPICLPDGSRPGVLSVSGLEPQPYDAGKAARLKDLADFLADEWDRARIARAHAQSVRERDAAHERSERAEERLNLALALADVHVWEMDFRRGELNEGGLDESQVSEPQAYESARKDIYGSIDPRDRAAVEAAWRDHVETGAPYRPEYRLDRPDGRELWVMASTKLFRDEQSRPMRVLGAFQNITERKLAELAVLRAKEDAEAASQAMSAFLASVSAEIRAPLIGVLSMAKAMAADDPSPAQRARLDAVRRSGEALLEILNHGLEVVAERRKAVA